MLFMSVIRQLVRRCTNFVTILAGKTPFDVHRQVMAPQVHFHFATLWAAPFISFQTRKIWVFGGRALVVVLDKIRVAALDSSLALRSFQSIIFGLF